MTDPRMTRLAQVLIHYSCEARAGDNVLIEAIDIPHEFTSALVAAAHGAGARPLVLLKSNAVQRSLLQAGTKEQWELIADVEEAQMKRVQCYIGARGSANVSELSDVPAEKMRLYETAVWQRVHHGIRVPKTRWVVLRWPSPSMAQMAEMSTPAFEDFYFNVCTLDYAKMARATVPLVDLMQKTDRVRLKGPGETDLAFSIRNIPARPCTGHRNIPDGECYTAPVRDSVNGVIKYNTPTLYRGITHNDVRLVFKNGKIVEATSSDTKAINDVFNSDEGARYVGEFAIGFNPFCTKPMKDILFDEKIAGSIHFTPGSCYKEADNGNVSTIHWDMVLRQTPDCGGGEVWFDDKLIRKDGRFVLKDLEALNPENLK
jgi:aminopeptidase